jgi:hypothetical protein
MAPVSRLSVALKGAILWVLLCSVLGLLPWLVVRNDATASIPWVAAAFGVIGAASHAAVVSIKSEPLHLKSSVAAITGLCSAAFLALTYWIVGPISEPVHELAHILAIVVAPAFAVSYAVLRLQRRQGAA